MSYSFPHTITNCTGETLVFKEVIQEADGDRVLVENFVAPQSGPPMHTHFMQDEVLTIVKGQLAYQVKGQSVQYAGEGETVEFKRGVPHRFWNAGSEELHCTGWIKPANTIVFYLTAVFDAQNKSGTERPEMFDGAYLLTRYASEYEMADIPWLVKKTIIPVTYYVGRLLGKYNHFRNAPKPLS